MQQYDLYEWPGEVEPELSDWQRRYVFDSYDSPAKYAPGNKFVLPGGDVIGEVAHIEFQMHPDGRIEYTVLVRIYDHIVPEEDLPF